MTTPNHGYARPDEGTTDWDTLLNNNFGAIDSDVSIVDTDANITTTNYSPDGQLAVAHDTATLYYGNTAGPSWDAIGTIGSGGGVTDFEGLNDVSSGLLANRPTAGTAGNWYFTTGGDGGIYYDDGTQWITVSERDTDTRAYTLANSGSSTLASGSAIADTGVSTDSSTYTVNYNPGTADIAASLDGSGTTFAIHFEEHTTTVGNPTVTWQLLRSNL